ncbi:MAG TPA: FAD-dependent oxidoreductase [Defluviitaleaceae bacterium]|nr:FAD-dependent oxidoreductase [Defluviitaleaceae bacterium]HPT75354.1 FAD-dependent oxidoreductase [Defluviitaleaceae bacterium]
MIKEKSNSYWITSTKRTAYPELTEEISVDAAIIGGGMAGISCAYYLKNEGLKVCIIDRKRILEGVTGHTTAKITAQHHLIYDSLISDFGIEKASQYAEANLWAIEEIDRIISENHINCDFIRQPAFVYTQSDEYIEKIEKELRAAEQIGIHASFENELPLPFSVKAAIKFDNQAQFHPRKFLLSLAEKLVNEGVLIYENTRMKDISDENPYRVITDKGEIKAKYVIIASHFPVYDHLAFYFARMYQSRTYALGLKIKEKFPGGMYLSAESPSRSLRAQPTEEGELVLLVGEEHKTGQPQETKSYYEALKKFACENYDVESIPYHWSTQDCMPLDNIPYIGRIKDGVENMFVATGFKKWGMTHSIISGLIIKDLIINRDNSWIELYNPSRFTLKQSFKKFFEVNLDVAKELVSGKLEIPENSLKDLKNEEGVVIDIEGRKVGAYKDNKGEVYLVDTTCSHLGCELKWNDAEKSWDCPCHGSRFTYTGEVIQGPAVKNLQRLN